LPEFILEPEPVYKDLEELLIDNNNPKDSEKFLFPLIFSNTSSLLLNISETYSLPSIKLEDKIFSLYSKFKLLS
jgi:hypothetical protein